MPDADHALQCLEVWGGNQAIDNGVTMPGLDAWVYCRPYKDEDGGGDVHFVSSCASGRVVRVLLADVSGHGQAVAPIATGLRDLMRAHVNRANHAELVGSLNAQFTGLARLGTFATAIVATYWTPTDSLVLCNAGHPRPFLYSARTGQWTVLDTRGEDAPGDDEVDTRGGKPIAAPGAFADLPLGILDLTEYRQFGCRLARGDRVLLYSDALVESRRCNGEFLGEDGLLALANETDAADAATFIPRLLARVTDVCGEAQDDDVSLLLLGPNALKPRFTFGEKLRVVGRIGGEVVRALGRGRRPALPELTLTQLAGPFIPRLNGWDANRPPRG